MQWHTDQSPESQTPGTTSICMLESPEAAGGDTLVSPSVQAYKSLSPRFQKPLEGLTAIDSNNDGVTHELQNDKVAVMRRAELNQEISLSSSNLLPTRRHSVGFRPPCMSPSNAELETQM